MLRVIWQRLAAWFCGWLHGGPHFIVGSADRPYLLRWYIIPRNPLFNVYLHKFMRDDDGRALHDHPWFSVSLLLRGRYWEVTPRGRREYQAGAVVVRRATHRHRIQLPGGTPAWTLFLTGPVVREWGFHCPAGFRPRHVFIESGCE